MTTTVTVNAHCDSDTTEVLVVTKEPDGFGGGESTEKTILQNGESQEFYAFDEREITVKEVDKGVNANAE